jgi:hypothetical protein
MVGSCRTHGSEEECLQDFGGKTRRKETTDGRIIRKWILEEQHGSMDWIPLAQDRDQ